MRITSIHPAPFSGAEFLADCPVDDELRALERETDPEFFFEGLMQYALRRVQAGDLEAAARLFDRLQSESVPAVLRERARREFDAILGRGDFGPRAEFLLRRFASEAADPATLAAMGVAATVFRTVRLGALSRLVSAPTAGVFTRGFGARAAASLAGFALEAPAFSATHRLAGEALGRPQDWSRAGLGRDLASSYLVLAGLKLAGWGSGAAFEAVGAGLPRVAVGAVRERPLRILFQQTGMLAGILLGHRAEEWAGLRVAQPGATTLVDSLALLLQFNLAGRLSRHAFGEGFLAWEQDLEGRHQVLRAFPAFSPVFAPHPVLASGLAMAALGDPNGTNEITPAGGAASVLPAADSPAYRQFRYPPGGRDARPPALRYDAETRRLWREVTPSLKGVPFEASAEEILASRADLDRADRLWLAQIRDYAKLVSAEVAVHPAARLLEPMSSTFLRPEGTLLRRAAELAGAEPRVYEVRFPYANAAFGRPNPKGHYSNLRNLLSELEDSFGNKILLQHVEQGRLTVRLPNFALWEGLLVARFGAQAHRPVFVDGLIPRDPVMRLRGKILAPVGLVRQPAHVYELMGRVHPFFVAFHDLFHATMASLLPVDLCRSCAAIYFGVMPGLPNSRIKQEHMNRLADLDPGSDYTGNAEELVRFSFAHFWNDFSKHVDAGTMTSTRLLIYPRFLHGYERLLNDPRRVEGLDDQWRERFVRRLSEMSQDFSRLMKTVLRG